MCGTSRRAVLVTACMLQPAQYLAHGMWDLGVWDLLLELSLICSVILFKFIHRHVPVPLKQMDHNNHTLEELNEFWLMFMRHWKFPVGGWYESAKYCNYSSISVGSFITSARQVMR